jgi:serine/threonine protein kinase
VSLRSGLHFLDAACQSEPELRAEIEQLLAEDAIAGGFLDRLLLAGGAEPLSVGMLLGPYEVLGSIGVGGMGEVYRASDTRPGRTVAIKLLPRHLSDDPNVRARLKQEARAIAGLNHPNICTLYDVAFHNENPFLVIRVQISCLSNFRTLRMLNIAQP